MFYDAFKKSLNQDLKIVLNIIPKETYHNVSIGISDDYVSYDVDGHIIKFPYRIYFKDVTDNEYESLNELQKIILCCIYTRSCNGYVREKYVKKLLESSFEKWTFPFIIKLCDEYVVEILELIYSYLKDKDNSEIQAFCLENKRQIKKGYSRMISYWNEFYRSKESCFKKYVGRKLYRECLGYNEGKFKDDDIVIKQFLLNILEDLNTKKISKERAINRLNQNNKLVKIITEKEVSYCITDCYFMIKHLLEEDISNNEIVYFIECLKNEREYNLYEKNKQILR